MKNLMLQIFIISLIISCVAQADALNYVMTDIGTMGGISAGASLINDVGDVVGIVNAPDIKTNPGNYNIYLWQNGTVTYLDQYFSYAIPYGLNNKAQAVGYAYVSGRHHAMLWENGGRTLLFDGSDIFSSSAYDINDSGQIVGYVYYSQPNTRSGAFLWENGRTTILCSGWAYDINNNGAIIGQRSIDSGSGYFIWKNGIFTELVSSDGSSIRPIAINDLDQVIGYCNDRAILWNNGMLTDLTSLYSVDSISFINTTDCFNNNRQIIGEASLNGRRFNFVSYGNNLIELTGDIWRLDAINNNGQVAGSEIFSDGHQHAVRWDPIVPELTSLLALLSGIGSFGALYLLRRKAL